MQPNVCGLAHHALAARAGAAELHFKDVQNSPADNGEWFLSDYLKEQLECYWLYGEHELNYLCQCPYCLGAHTAQGAASPMAADEMMEPSGQDEVAEVDIDGHVVEHKT
jgi:hypothetical protein